MSTTILLVDDDTSSRMLLSEFLEDSDYQVSSAQSCKEALELARNKSFDAAILDLNLPDGTGIQLLSQLRPLQLEIKVFILTGENEEEIEQKLEQENAQVSGIISKPFSLVGILSKLEGA